MKKDPQAKKQSAKEETDEVVLLSSTDSHAEEKKDSPAPKQAPESETDIIQPMRNKPLLLASGIAAVAVVGFVVAATSFNGTGTPASVGDALTEEEQQEEIDELLREVSEHILLPEGETPLVATITDAESLIAEQPFYTGVQDGDRLIIYTETLKAIIYSPERGIIVNVGPIQLPQIDDGVVVPEETEEGDAQ